MGTTDSRGNRCAVSTAWLNQDMEVGIAAGSERCLLKDLPEGFSLAGNLSAALSSTVKAACGASLWGRRCGDGLLLVAAPWLMKRARANRYIPERKEPGGGRRDSSAGRGRVEAEGSNASGCSPCWFEELPGAQ